MIKRFLLGMSLSLFIVIRAEAATFTYQYKDNAGNLFNIQLFQCLAGPVYCTAMTLQDSSGNAVGTTSNPFTIDTAASGNLINAIKAPPALATTGGWTPFTKIALTTTVVAVKTTAGQLGFAQCDNLNTGMAYLQIFNVAAGSVVLGSTAPTQVMSIPTVSSNSIAMSFVGMEFSTAISIAAATTASGSTSLTTAINCSFGYN